ncbi:hypothetical protein D3C72_2506780 [compost metagenome]
MQADLMARSIMLGTIIPYVCRPQLPVWPLRLDELRKPVELLLHSRAHHLVVACPLFILKYNIRIRILD